MINKKGQAALEFLTTYGWAILVILVMVGALIYFGVANPNKILPEKCEVQTGFECKDFQITEDGFSIILANKLGESIKGVKFGTDPYSEAYIGTIGPGECTSSLSTVGADERFTLSCASTGLFQDLGGRGEKVKITYELNYTPARQTYPKTMSGTIFGTVS